MAVFPYLLGVGLVLLLHSFRSRATSWVTPTHVMSSLICWCHVLLGRPRRLVSGIASSITLRVTLSASRLWIFKSNLKIKPTYFGLITKPRIRLPPKFKSILSHIRLCDLISRSDYIHPNPGPRQAGPTIYSCGTCHRRVKNRDNAILRDECNIWHHINGVGISPSTYHSLVNQTALWFCEHCGVPNYTTTFSSDEHSISHTDSYEHNNAILYDHDNEQTVFGPNPKKNIYPWTSKENPRKLT